MARHASRCRDPKVAELVDATGFRSSAAMLGVESFLHQGKGFSGMQRSIEALSRLERKATGGFRPSRSTGSRATGCASSRTVDGLFSPGKFPLQDLAQHYGAYGRK